MGDASINANPRTVEFGSAPIDPFYPQARQNKGEGPCAV